MAADKEDPPPDSCAVCGYHLANQECRRHAPHPGHDEDHVAAVWNFTPDHARCGAGTTTGTWVSCDDCTHWWLPHPKLLIDQHNRQGLPDVWWEHARICSANPPGATIDEGRMTFWRVTSKYPLNGLVGGCGDGVSITAILEAEAKANAKKPKKP